MIDPSETCGYALDHQYNMLEQLKELFSDVKIIAVENKVDIITLSSAELKISCKTKEGIDQLTSKIFNILNKT